jgi:hypothetical protein
MPSDAALGGARARGPLVVEFLGLPGSGKTTLSAALVALLEERDLPADSLVGAARDHVRRTRPGRVVARVRPPRLRRFLLWQLFYAFGVVHAFRFGREDPALVRHALGALAGRHDRIRTRAHVLYWFFHLCGRYRFMTATSRPGEVLVVDDGFLQRAVHLHATPADPPDPDQVKSYVDLVPKPDLLVLLTVSRTTGERRVYARGIWPHLRHLDAPALSRYLAHAERVVTIAAGEVKRRGWPVIEIRTDGGNPHPANGALRHVLAPLVHWVGPKPFPGAGAVL